MFNRILTAAAAAVAAFVTPTVLAQSESGYWHEQYHGLLSMASYGDYLTTCPQKFTTQTLHSSFPDSTETPFVVMQVYGPTTDGLKAFLVQVPEMNKLVLVFGGLFGWQQMDHSSVPIAAALHIDDCDGCQAHGGALRNYLELKQDTADWAWARQVAATSGHEFSITGHGFGGMVGLVAALDLGWNGVAHWSHAHGTPRTFNLASAELYEQLYAGEAGQNTIANNDPIPHFIPRSDDYIHPRTSVYIWGDGHNETFGMNWKSCREQREDPDCQGEGNNMADHYFYYTPIGQCGQSPYFFPNQTQVDQVLSLGLGDYTLTAASSASQLPEDQEDFVFSASDVAEPMSVTAPPSADASDAVKGNAEDGDNDDESGTTALKLSMSAALAVISVALWIVLLP